MGLIMVANFGVIEGVQTYRVNGTKDDLSRLVKEVRGAGHHFREFPIIEKVTKDIHSVLIKVEIAQEESVLKSYA